MHADELAFEALAFTDFKALLVRHAAGEVTVKEEDGGDSNKTKKKQVAEEAKDSGTDAPADSGGATDAKADANGGQKDQTASSASSAAADDDEERAKRRRDSRSRSPSPARTRDESRSVDAREPLDG